MSESYQELIQIAETLEALLARSEEPQIRQSLEQLKQAAEQAGKAWSGSWLGYHANVYYKHLQPPPPGTHFSAEWGRGNRHLAPSSTDDWVEYDPDQVSNLIQKRAGNPDMKVLGDFDKSVESAFSREKSNLLSIIEIQAGYSESQFLADQEETLNKLSLISEQEYLQSWQPKQSVSRDSLAVYQGHWIPPHVRVLAQVVSIQNSIAVITNLAEIARQVASHTSRQQQRPQPRPPAGTRVFIGHGHSLVWLELKDFIENRLGLLVDEFNRVSSAGIPTTGRLSAMLDSAAFAFLLMTGEDEQTDGQVRARENVVHEAGLFQGRLGFERAIILLEEGCQEYSNIIGLGQIRFPKGKSEAAFEEIRKVLEREGILKTGATP